MNFAGKKGLAGSASFETPARQRAPGTSRAIGDLGYSASLGRMLQGIALAAMSAGLFWLVWLYGNGLRDPRYLDGWLLAGGMCLQLGFHIAIKSAALSPKSAVRWRQFHIFLGYLLIAAFVSHSNLSLPDTGFEWALWACFVLVTLTGLFGTYLAWSLRAKRGTSERMSSDRIATRRAELARDVHAIVETAEPEPLLLPLPAPPYDAWVMDLYTNHLREFFSGPHNFTAHLIGSQRPLKQLLDTVDGLSPYVDKQGQDKLATIKALVVEKDRLDFARVHNGLSEGWLFVHVPVTYALIVLTLAHVVTVYSFSSGDW